MKLIRPLLLLLLLWLALLQPQPLWARENFESNPDFKQATELMRQEKYIKARELAEAMLKKNPRDYCACYVLGHVYLWGEGSLPRAYHFLWKARRLLERDWSEHVDSSGPWKTHAETLEDLAMTCGQMDRYQEELDVLADRNRLYTPKVEEELGWPLMKQGNLKRARQAMLEVLSNKKEERARVTALNTLGAIEMEEGDLVKSRDYYQQLYEEIKSHGWDMECTFPRNLAAAEIYLGNYPRAEELLLESSQHYSPYAYTNPWGDVALLYLSQGRFPEVLSAIKRMQGWAANSSPVVVTQTWAERQAVTAEALLAFGYDDVAELLLRRIIYRPDRNMATSSQAYITEVGTMVIFRTALICRKQRLREEMSWCTWPRWFENASRLVALSSELDQITERSAAQIIQNAGLHSCVQAYQNRSVYGDWLLPDVNNLFGTGVVACEVKKILSEQGPNLQVERPFLLAVLAEGNYLTGSRSSARKALEEALQALPPSQKMLRSRMEAELADTLWAQGSGNDALGHYGTAFELNGGVFRELRMSLPASITSGGGPLASQAAGYLRNSPRFFPASQGFRIQVSQSPSGLSASVLDQRGTQIASVQSPNKNQPDETVRAFCQRFHEFVFSARLDLSQMDINDINGSTASGSVAREQLLKSLNMEIPTEPEAGTR